jgi:hypothetical protein
MRSTTRFNVLIAGDSYDQIVPVVSALLVSRAFSLTVSELHAFSRLPDLIVDDTHAVVLFLTEVENSVELKELVSRFPETAFLFVAPRKPARAALARLADALGAGLVTADDAPVVMEATLTSLLAQHERHPGRSDPAPERPPGSAREGAA